MPIRPEFRQFYGKEWRTVTRPRIVARAGNRCEQCSKPNRARVVCRFLHAGPAGPARMFWTDPRDPRERWFDQDARQSPPPRFYDRESSVAVVCTVGHVNQIEGDDRDENLKFWCQYCHLKHDREQHTRNARKTRIRRKDAARPLIRLLDETKPRRKSHMPFDPQCVACIEQRMHTPEEWKHHPDAAQGQVNDPPSNKPTPTKTAIADPPTEVA